MSEQRGFSSSFGAIMAAVGSAVGLGNIWRFPYITGKYGGGAFLLVYIIFVFFLGRLLMLSEFVIGRRSQHGPLKAYTSLCPKQKWWKGLGLLSLITVFLILGQYAVVSGWTCNYVWDSVTGVLTTLSPDEVTQHFTDFSTGTWAPIVCLLVFLALTALVVLGGVEKGIEAVSKLLMPLLIVLVLALGVRSVTLPGASEGLAYLFKPDFSKLTSEGILAALGQALFSLSVGMGAMVVYGSYIPKNDHLFKTAMWITLCDTLIAILAGVAIFPAVFACGQSPSEGAGLVFTVLPNVFNSMGAIGQACSICFFVLLGLAALTSAISLLEPLVQAVLDSGKGTRPKATFIFTLAAAALAIVCALNGTIFNFIDSINSIYLPPLCALGTVIFFGWFMPKDAIRLELANGEDKPVQGFRVFYFIVKYIAPIALLVVLVSGIVQ